MDESVQRPALRTLATDSVEPPIRVTFTDPLLQMRATPTAEPEQQASSQRWYSLALRAHRHRTAASFDRLLAPAVLYDRVRPHGYQLRVVEQVLREKAPAAILADDVGLGKTIEAGLIYKELALRGLVRTALVLAPKSLLSQWQQELREHFDEDFVLTDEKRFRGFEVEPRVICSLPQFVRSFARVNSHTWDCVIADEAHLLANPASRRRQCVSELRSTWRLLLTATPVANRITDLYSLIDLAVPGASAHSASSRRSMSRIPAYVVWCGPTESLTCATLPASICAAPAGSTPISLLPGERWIPRRIQAGPAEDALISDITDYLRALFRRTPTGSSKVNRGAVIREIMALQQSLEQQSTGY